jgi:hypothetical protein
VHREWGERQFPDVAGVLLFLWLSIDSRHDPSRRLGQHGFARVYYGWLNFKFLNVLKIIS